MNRSDRSDRHHPYSARGKPGGSGGRGRGRGGPGGGRGRGRYSNDSSSGQMRSYNSRGANPSDDDLADPRMSRERPSRTLFVRNVPFSVPNEQLEAMFSKYGELRELFSLVENRGIAFVTYYDIRNAEEAKEGTHNTEIEGRQIDVHYSLPRDTVSPTSKCDETKNQGTLFVVSRGGNKIFSVEDIQHMFEKYGQVAYVRPLRDLTDQKFVEFYDSRSCVRAVNDLHGKMVDGVNFEVEYAWDKSTKESVYLGRKAGDRYDEKPGGRGRRTRYDDRSDDRYGDRDHDDRRYSRDTGNNPGPQGYQMPLQLAAQQAQQMLALASQGQLGQLPLPQQPQQQAAPGLPQLAGQLNSLLGQNPLASLSLLQLLQQQQQQQQQPQQVQPPPPLPTPAPIPSSLPSHAQPTNANMNAVQQLQSITALLSQAQSAQPSQPAPRDPRSSQPNANGQMRNNFYPGQQQYYK